MEESVYQQRGYLRESWRLFHLRDELAGEVDSHYHEFFKLVFFRSGRVTYSVEGRHSDLQPDDIVLVPMGSVHRVEADPAVRYERVILYLSPVFLLQNSTADCDLTHCFRLCREKSRYVLRPQPEDAVQLRRTLRALEQNLTSDAYGAERMADALLVQLLIELGRQAEQPRDALAPARVLNPKAVELLHYIDEHLAEDISIDALAERFFISKYHMMRSFRAETGFTIHGYITEKRLLLARAMMQGGRSAADACFDCGYRDYSAFSRAFKKKFGVSPRGGRSL